MCGPQICEDVPQELDCDVPGLDGRPIDILLPKLFKVTEAPIHLFVLSIVFGLMVSLVFSCMFYVFMNLILFLNMFPLKSVFPVTSWKSSEAFSWIHKSVHHVDAHSKNLRILSFLLNNTFSCSLWKAFSDFLSKYRVFTSAWISFCKACFSLPKILLQRLENW